MENNELIKKFYTAFAAGDAEGMVACYHDDIVFEDPAFGVLKGDRAKAMWKMLLGKGKSEITFSDISANSLEGKAQWIAKYNYGSKKRPVVNHVTAVFQFAGGKIISHKDDFHLWTWAKQALGLSGYLLGWSSFMKTKIQNTTHHTLTTFMNE